MIQVKISFCVSSDEPWDLDTGKCVYTLEYLLVLICGNSKLARSLSECKGKSEVHLVEP